MLLQRKNVMNARVNNGRRAMRRSGFTLIELLLVMVILVVLAAVVVPRFADRGKQARETAARTDVTSLETALDAFEIDNGRYPSTEEGLQALVSNPSGLTNWRGPYVKSVPADPWGQTYVYQYPGSHNPSSYDLASYGPDMHEGGNDDITNWKAE
jgi:general secretion pathway protein G